MIRENRWLLFGLGSMLILPLIVTVMAFTTLASTEVADLVAGTPLVITPTATAPRVTPTSAPNLNAIYEAGTAAFQTGDLALAEALFTEAVSLAPDEADLHNSLGLALARQNRLREAVAVYETAVTLNPQFAEAH